MNQPTAFYAYAAPTVPMKSSSLFRVRSGASARAVAPGVWWKPPPTWSITSSPVLGALRTEPLEFMQRLAALVPRPRLHLICFHGVLAPNAKLRPQIIPSAPVNANDKLADHGDARPPSAPARLRWAQLLKRVFDIDIERCSHCGGPLTIIAAHPRPRRDRQDPLPSRLTYPRTTARTRAALRAPPKRLIANQYPSPRGSAP